MSVPMSVPELVCGLCSGTGWESVAGKGVRECQCVFEKRVKLWFDRARIPGRYKAASFENFEANCPSLHRALLTSKKFVEEYPCVDVGLLYLGSCGVGKTHLAIVVLKELIRKGNSGLFYDFRDLLKEIQNSYNPNTHTSELKILAPVLETDVLVLDELGAAKPTEWVQETMTYVINQRYNEKKVTIFTSNYLDIQIGVADETLIERVGVRLRSRLDEMCRLISVEAEDYRRKLREQRGGRFTEKR